MKTEYTNNSKNTNEKEIINEVTDTAPVKKSYPWTWKRIAAIAGIAALAGMYVAAFIASLFSGPAAQTLLRVSIALTVIVPLLLWILLWAAGRFR